MGLRGTKRALLARRKGYTYKFGLDDVTFSAAMAVRAGQAAFDAAPIFQGKWDGTGVPDVVSFPRGTLLGNQTQYFYSNFDPYQGTLTKWWTAETSSVDRASGYGYVWYVSSAYYCRYDYANSRFDFRGGNVTVTRAQAIVAGTTYHIVYSFDTKNTIDGTNNTRNTVNDSHAYGGSSLAASAPDAAICLGSDGSVSPANAILEGLICYRRVLYDGAYGTPMWFDASGALDEIAAIYASGAGLDPCTLSGSFDVTVAVPTDQTQGPLQTTGQAHSHPHSSIVIDVPFVDDGGLPGTDYAVGFDGADTILDCGSDATLDDIPSGGEITIDCWFKANSFGESDQGAFFCKHNFSGVNGYSVNLSASGQITSMVGCATTDAQATIAPSAVGLTSFVDGKWHLLTFHYEDTTKWISLAVDGRWATAYVFRPQGIGNYTTEAAYPFRIGVGNYRFAPRVFDGAIAWIEVWDNDHHTAGTDFIAPRAPTAAGPGNLIETWWADEGTGATVAARVTSPANDGTITSGSWSSIWAIVGTPVVPQSLEFFQENDGIDFGSGANIDDLPSADCTIEFWARVPEGGTTNSDIITKTDAARSVGWSFIYLTAPGVRLEMANGAIIVVDFGGADNVWHHFAVDWEQATDTARSFLDGVLVGTDTSVGAYSADAAQDCLVNARGAIGTGDTSFSIGWLRLSDTRRYTGNSFIPDARTNPPANDGNAQLLVNMDDGAGTTATDSSGSGYHGTITFGANTRWNNTPDMSVDEPGAMIYSQGYNIGSDGANDGIYIPVTLTASTDYVLRVPLTYDPQAWPRITFWDVVGGASLVDFDAPPLTGVHSGANNSATLTVAGEVFPASLIGSALYNVTDGSSTTITAVGGTNQDTITGVLAGGTDDDWDTNDAFYIVPYSGWVFNEPIVARTNAQTTFEVRNTNRNALGVTSSHMVEALVSLLSGGDMEAGAGDPYIPTGWSSVDLDAGDTLAEAAVIHSGAQSLEFAVGASGEGIRQQMTIAAGAYFQVFVWTYGDGSAGFTIGGLDATQMVVQASTTAFTVDTPHTAGWSLTEAVFRAVAANPYLYIMADAGAAGARYVDDVAAISDTAVTLTVTPASEANSLEGTGIRVDGRDSATVPAATYRMKARSGSIKWRATARHAFAQVQDLGQTYEYLLHLWEDANNYVYLRRTAGASIQLVVNQQGAGAVADADTPVWAADQEALFELINGGSRIRVRMDGVVILEVAGLAGFATDFTVVAFFGSQTTPQWEFDGVISPP